MRKITNAFGVSTTLAAAIFVMSGCGGQSAPVTKGGAESGGHDDHAHEHAATGPHGGEIIELGTADYHAEIVHDTDATVYILDGSAKAPAALDVTEIAVNLSHDGKSEQFKLAAKPAAGDAPGKSSVFTSAEPELVADLKEGHAEVQLVVMIGGKQFRGTLEHEHEEGHEH